ncbi:MAG TPA: low molecular weight protein arginine phosphatase [Oscillospiraceae bacterium]|nr:low molecular weight protein arginine phosphatase [Oscillospiraceae bacterium]
MRKISKQQKLLLFVCTGNTCRSPLAQVMAAAQLAQADLSDWRVASAGLAALKGMSASKHALTVANALQLDLSVHQSQPFTAALAAQADLILVMTDTHQESILQQQPQLKGKVSTIREFSGSTGNVQDPFGGTAAEYLATAQELESLLQTIVKKLAAAGVKKQDEGKQSRINQGGCL